MDQQPSLRQWEIFSHFTDPLLSQLEAALERRSFARGETIVREGDPSLDAYLIESGHIRIQRKTPYGRFSLASLTPGSFFGETAFVDRIPRSGDAVAAEETTLLTLSPDALAPQLEADPRFKLALYWSFWKSLSAKLRQTNDNLTQFFSETGKPPTNPPVANRDATGEFHVDLASKRKLFQEQKLSNLEINFLTSLSREKNFAPNQVIFHEGDEGDALYIVLEGRVMISKYIPGAGEEALAFLERGGYFGEMALIDNAPRSADAKAHEGGAVVLAIPRDVLEGILDINKISSIRLLTILCTLVASRLRELDDKIIGWFIIAGGSGISWPVEQE